VADRVFAVAAHPDDIEFVMSGTMMLLREAGYELHYMNIANGSCGSSEMDAETTARRRREEARKAARALGATFHESLTNDLEIFYDRPTLLRLASIMRQVAPRILLVHSPEDYMEDHMNACRLAVTAAFSRGMPNFPVDPDWPPTSQEVTIYHAQPHGNCDGLGRSVWPHLFVDVSDLIDRKRELLALHVSQKQWLDESQGMDSYLATMQQLCRDVGTLSGRFALAEGWRRHSHLGFCATDDDPLTGALGERRVARASTHETAPRRGLAGDDRHER
jgi:LmbE family N-acetylglucosaminyl deacetylase